VTAADSVDAAVKALQRAAATAQGLKQIEAVTRDLFRRPFVAAELKNIDAVVFDPPRQGAEAQARELAKSGVKTVVAVSCDPATFARDVRVLTQGGYRLTSVTPVDQFRYSYHVEVVGTLEK
jgi:23S rRNA (uracil1939-C5)-methyltransferase